MKKLNIKKLAAIAAGAALVGTAIAPVVTAAFTGLAKTDVVDASGNPTVSIVAGVQADVSDFVWAGNIAAKVAQLATKTTPVTQGSGDGNSTLSNVSVDLTVGGSTTVTGGKEFKDSYLTSVQGSTTSGRWEFGRSTTVQGVTLTSRPVQLSKSQIASLYEASQTLRYNGTDSTVSVKEYIGLNADVRFDTAGTQWQDLAMFITSENDFNYIVDLGTGIYRYETTVGTTNFQDDVNDNQKIPLFGKNYVVQQVNNTDTGVNGINYVRLIEDTSKQTFTVGDSFTVVGKAAYAYAGQTLTAKLTQVGQSASGGAYTAKFTLYDEDGVEINSQSVNRKNYVQFQDGAGNYIVQDSIYFDDILVTNTQDLSTATVDLFVGAASVDLYNAKGYPYDASNTNGPWDWKVTLLAGSAAAGSSTDANKLLSITIGNSNKTWTASNPIYPSTTGQSLMGKTSSKIELLSGTGDPNEGYAYVEFKGWEEKESTTPIVLGNNNLKFKDTSGTEHNIPFYINVGLSTGGSSFAFDTKTVYFKTGIDGNFTLGADNNVLNGVTVKFGNAGTAAADGNQIWTDFGDVNIMAADTTNIAIDINHVSYSCSTDNNATLNCLADGNITFAKASTSTATDSDRLGGMVTAINDSYYYDDGNTAKIDANRAFRASPVVLEGANSQTYNYALFVNESYSPEVWLVLDAQTLATEYNKNIQFWGTDTAEAGFVVPLNHPRYYFPDALAFGGSSADQAYYIATFAIDQNNSTGDYDANIYIDTATNKTPTYTNNFLSNYNSDVNLSNSYEGGATFYLRNDNPYLHAAYTDWGSKFVLADGVVTITLPQNRRYLDLIVGGNATSTTPTGGEDLTGLKLDETQTTAAGTKITVTNVTGTCSGGGACTPEEYEMVVPLSRGLVYTDETLPTGKVIIVGGYLVNTLAQSLTLGDGTTLEDALTQPGDMVAEKLVNGDMVVAGYTGADTGRAAQELITALDALVQ